MSDNGKAAACLHGRQIHEGTDGIGLPPFVEAARHNDYNCIVTLLQSGTEENVNRKFNGEYTALFYAEHEDNAGVAKYIRGKCKTIGYRTS